MTLLKAEPLDFEQTWEKLGGEVTMLVTNSLPEGSHRISTTDWLSLHTFVYKVDTASPASLTAVPTLTDVPRSCAPFPRESSGGPLRIASTGP